MKNLPQSVFSLVVVAVVGLLAFAHFGFADLRWPWSVPEVNVVSTVIEQPKAATITRIEPIALDCRARIHSSVPIEGRREHRALGQVYRTDTVSMTAIGDIDTCVDPADVEVITDDDGNVRVIVPADAVQFVRPRVDAEATLDSVRVNRGLVGKLTDILPWVSDNSGLTPAAYAYAQGVIGSEACLAEAFDTTAEAMIDAYREAMTEAGLDPSALEVDVVGSPDFSIESGEANLDGFDFDVAGDGAICEVSDIAYRPNGGSDAGRS